jgi:hypothetical protein
MARVSLGPSSINFKLSGSLLGRQAGKVKRVLFCGDGHTVVIGGTRSISMHNFWVFTIGCGRSLAGTFDHLVLWDTREPDSCDIKTTPLKIRDSGVLDMTWRRVQSCVQLLVLSSCGEHLVFPTHQDLAKSQFGLQEVVESLSAAAHSSQKSFKHGTITCWESVIASTVGLEVAVREVQSGALVPVIAIHYRVNHLHSFS